MLTRFIGAVFAAGGVIMLVAAAIGHFTKTS